MAFKSDFLLTFASFLLIGCMALPSVMKLSHAIHGHNTRKCNDDISLHLHKAEFDCEFQKFKLSQLLYPPLQYFDHQLPSDKEQKIYDYYDFLGVYQTLHFSLRGPPVVS